MTGESVYEQVTPTSEVRGFQLTKVTLAPLAEEVQALLTDSRGAEAIKRMLADVTKTDFQMAALEKILTSAAPIAEWRVGEALAELDLVQRIGCFFPWPSGRDTRNPNSSGGGVDLIGFQMQDSGIRFALGEVKTSYQQLWPPSVVTGRHGLHKQLEGLAGGDDRRTWAILYLAHHAVGSEWESSFRSAFQMWGEDENNVLLCGTLVHVTDPNPKDLSGRIEKLLEDCPDSTYIHLIALYLPEDGLEMVAGAAVEKETAA